MFGFCGHGTQIAGAVCGSRATKQGDSKGGGAPLWHTTLLARCSVLYLPARLAWQTGAVLYAPACHGRKTGRIFANGNEQKACPSSFSGGRYTAPGPTSRYRLAEKTRNGVRRASTLGLARLTGRKAKPGGAVNGGAKRRSSRPLTVLPGFAISAANMNLYHTKEFILPYASKYLLCLLPL